MIVLQQSRQARLATGVSEYLRKRAGGNMQDCLGINHNALKQRTHSLVAALQRNQGTGVEGEPLQFGSDRARAASAQA